MGSHSAIGDREDLPPGLLLGGLAEPLRARMPYWNPEESLEGYLNLALRLSGSAFGEESAAEPVRDSSQAAASAPKAPEAAVPAHTAHEAPNAAMPAHTASEAAVPSPTAPDTTMPAHTASEAAVSAPTGEPTASAPEPALFREPTESAPEPAPFREPTESAPEPAPFREPTESAPDPAPFRNYFFLFFVYSKCYYSISVRLTVILTVEKQTS